MSCKNDLEQVWGLPKSFTTLDIRSNFVGIGLAILLGTLYAGIEGDHVRLVLTHKDSKGLTRALVGEVSCLRKIGCSRCVLDETNAGLGI